jgi:hypothetical protein
MTSERTPTAHSIFGACRRSLSFTERYRGARDDLAQERLEPIEAPPDRVLIRGAAGASGAPRGAP